MSSSGCQDYVTLTRRRFLGALGGAGAASFLGLWDPRILLASPGRNASADAVILLWMGGGQSHIDTWDPKPGTPTGGPFDAIQTVAADIRICEHFPRIASEFDDLSVIRSLTATEGNHERATYQMHTGYVPLGSFQHSTLGSVITRMKGRGDLGLPPYITIGGLAWPAGFLGTQFAPFRVANPQDPTRYLDYHRGVDEVRFRERLGLLREFDQRFRALHRKNDVLAAYAEHYKAAHRLMHSDSAKAFDLSREPETTRENYGATFFGQGCLLARRLTQAGVRFVEVTFPGWDTHVDNFEEIQSRAPELDRALAALIADLRQKDLLARTLVLLCTEFGRTPTVNKNTGRDHWPRVFSALIAGGGVLGGRAIGASSPGGEEVARDPVSVGQLHATLCRCLGIDYTDTNYAPDGRPIRVVKDPDAQPIDALLS